MSITSQINRLLQAKADIKSAIENKGGTVSSSAKLNDYAGLINNLAFPVAQPLSVTSNGTYSASSGYAYNPVTVNVQGGGGELAKSIIEGTAQSIYDNAVSSIRGYAFTSYYNLSSADFPNCELVGGYAFFDCKNLISFNFQNVKEIYMGAFWSCSKLTEVNAPALSDI